MSQKSNNLVYAVLILRTDGQHLEIVSSTNYDKCFEVWKKLTEEWTTSVKEQKPFIVEDPVITAFSPSLIYEVKLIPVVSEDIVGRSNNPYSKKMYDEGFGKTFPTHGRDLIG